MDNKRMTKATATKELIDRVCGKAVNEDDVPAAVLNGIVKKVEANDPSGDPEFLAYFAGLHDGSTAVARRWIERDPAAALVYLAGVKVTEEYLESESA